MQKTLDKYFKNENKNDEISLKVCDQLKDMTEDEYNTFMSIWVD